MAKYSSKKAYGDAEGPFGFPMPSAIAKQVEGIYKALPAELRDMGYQRRSAIPTSIDIQDEERTDISWVTTESIDRDGEVLLAKGADWSQFLQNSVVTFAHRYDQLPVGRALWVKAQTAKGRKGYLAKTHYTTRPSAWEGPWFADAVYHFIHEKDMPGKSVGFIITEAGPPEEKEIRARPELAGIRNIIRKWLVLEYAVAPVPSNPDALVTAVGKARAKGLVIPDCIFEETGLLIPTGVPSWEEYIQGKGEEEEEEVKPRPRRKGRVIVTRDSLLKQVQTMDVAAHVAAAIDTLKGKV